MSLLDNDDFAFSYGRSLELTKPPQAATEEQAIAPQDTKGRVKSGEFTLDSQKISSFSLRRRKDKDTTTAAGGETTRGQKKAKSIARIQPPPDSPKSKTGPSPGIKSSRKQQQYAHLLENDPSSGEDEEEEDAQGSFVLSKGHQAREKRGSLKSPNEDKSFESSVTNPTITDSTFGVSPIRTISNNSSHPIQGGAPPPPLHFPVSFSPLRDPDFSLREFSMFPETTASQQDVDFTLTVDNHPKSDPVPVIPPPPAPAPPSSQQPQFSPPTIIPQFQTTPTSDDAEWEVSDDLYEKCRDQFNELDLTGGLLSGEKARDFFLKSHLPVNELSKIWKLSDMDHDGSLSLDEFVVAMKLVLMRRKNFDIPLLLPHSLKVPLSQASSSPVLNFKFPPPPPPPPHANKRQTPVTPTAVIDPLTEGHVSLPVPSLPAFLMNSGRSKTEPIIALSDVQTFDVDHVAMDDKPNAGAKKREITKSSSADQKEVGVVDLLLNSSLMSESDVPLLPQEITVPVTMGTPIKEPAVSKLISISNETEESTGDEEDTLILVSSGEHPPVPKPRKKRRTHRPIDGKPTSELHRAQTVHGRVNHPPPRPPPYQKNSSASPPPDQSVDTSLVISSPVLTDNDLAPIISSPPSKPAIPPKPDLDKRKRESSSSGGNDKQVREDKGHGRSTSWDLTKMLKDKGVMRFHEDLPSAEPPKPPPRRNRDGGGGYHTEEDDDEGRKSSKLATPLQRSASTGSLASITSSGVPTPLIAKSRTSSVESGAILGDVPETLIVRSDTFRRPAPAPPPNKPKKPIYPPSFKKVKVDMSPDRGSGDNVALLSERSTVEVYQKKNKTELQKSIRRLKEENNMYNSLNSELTKKLNELKQDRYRLEGQLNHRRTTPISH